jgi:Skp family chaperone for outer membrane proteins
LENKLSIQRFTLSQESLEKLTQELERKRTESKRFLEDSQRDLYNLRIKLFNQIRKEVFPIIKEIGKEKGFSLILDMMECGAIYFDPSVDITDEIIKRYNQQIISKK